MKKIIAVGFGMCIAAAAVYGDGRCSGGECAPPSDGLYFLLGFGMSSVDNSVDAKSDICSDVNVPEVGMIVNMTHSWIFNDTDLPVVRNAGYEIVSTEPRPGAPGSFDAIKLRRRSSCRDRDSKFSGAAGIGFGKNLCYGWYIGGEALLDVGSPHRISNDGRLPGADGAMPYYMSSSGTTFSLAIRVAYEIMNGTRLYLKAGGALVRSEAAHSGFSERLKMSKITPLVAVGIEQRLCDAFSTRLELEHRFIAKKDCSLPLSDKEFIVFDGVVIPNLGDTRFRRESSNLRQKSKSWEARVVFQYTVNWSAF
ncbi:MAG: hypothetical protein LBD81_02695 [Holosporaceae bacterium]|jgi:hypothetical protein|nr:hypothetical protein [Holosporaceae bacterium]